MFKVLLKIKPFKIALSACPSVCLSVTPISSETGTPLAQKFGGKVRALNPLACSE